MNAKEETKLPLEKAPRRILTYKDIKEDAEDITLRLYDLRIKRDELLNKHCPNPGPLYEDRIEAIGKEIIEAEEQLRGMTEILDFPIPILAIEVE